MIYWIGTYIKSGNQGHLKATENVTPLKSDNRLLQIEEYKAGYGVDDDGNEYYYSSLFFESLMDWGLHFNRLSIDGILNSASKGSYIKITECYHDEKDSKGLCTKQDDLIYVRIV